MRTFCMNCGRKDDSPTRHNFCGYCGASFATGRVPERETQQKSYSREEEEDYEDQSYRGELRMPKFDPRELIIEERPKMMLGSIVNTAKDRGVESRPGGGLKALEKIKESVKSVKEKR